MMTEKNGDVSFVPLAHKTFKFRCHKGISCFTRCCANLNLVLTPYDILRLKRRLHLSSDQFLSRHTETAWDNHPRFPMIKLKMSAEKQGKCPFLGAEGCTIYGDRPGACRIYPLGRAATKRDGKVDAMEQFFIVEEGHCLGFREDREWAVEEWIKNEGLDEYNVMNDQWLEIITSSKGLGHENDVPRKIQMFYMASYNLDKLREFIFKSRFFERFEVPPDLREKLTFDDAALMKFAFDWLKFSLFGENTIQIKPRLNGSTFKPALARRDVEP